MEIQKKARLWNCLETILEMESQLHPLREAGALVTEIKTLRALMNDLQLVRTPMVDADIQRIELATTTFLRELEFRFQFLNTASPPERLLQ